MYTREFYFDKYLSKMGTLEGDIIEVGVFQGSTLRSMALTCRNHGIHKKIYGIDTFNGMPTTVIDGLDNQRDASGHIEGHTPGNFSDTSLQHVTEQVQDFPNVILIKGFFPDCAQEILNNKFCFAHIDVDIYQSTKDCYELIWPQLVSGGVIMCGDDYGKWWLRGCTKAIDEFVEKIGIVPIIIENGPHFLVKP